MDYIINKSINQQKGQNMISKCDECGEISQVEFIDDHGIVLCHSCAERWTNCDVCNCNVRLNDCTAGDGGYIVCPTCNEKQLMPK